MSKSIAELRGITKHYPGVTALDGIDLEFRAGEVHGLAGENGAGKSTLIKVLGGIIVAEEGDLLIDGEVVHFRSPAQALSKGIRVVHQELASAPHLTVTENILLGQLPTQWGRVDWKSAHQQAREKLHELGIDLDEHRKLTNLSLGQQQLVEVARALMQEARILILDEPSAILGEHDLEILFRTISGLRDRGVTIVYISHRLEELFELTDRVSVLKDGKYVGTYETSDLDSETLVEYMTGRELVAPPPRDLERPLAPALQVSGFSRPGALHDVSFSVGVGEIVGLAGMVGAGRTELARAIAGVDPVDTGELKLHGNTVDLRSPRAARQAGIGLLPKNRKEHGLLLNRSVRENIGIASLERRSTFGVLRSQDDLKEVEDLATLVDLRYRGPTQVLRDLSGGNQQKVLLARWLAAKSKVLLLDEPTRGVDVGGKSEIYKLMRDLAGEGVSMLMISSEIEEVVAMSDRVLVMRQGRLVAEFQGPEINEQRILSAALVDSVAASEGEDAA